MLLQSLITAYVAFQYVHLVHLYLNLEHRKRKEHIQAIHANTLTTLDNSN